MYFLTAVTIDLFYILYSVYYLIYSICYIIIKIENLKYQNISVQFMNKRDREMVNPASFTPLCVCVCV